jgi:hypothetical protein
MKTSMRKTYQGLKTSLLMATLLVFLLSGCSEEPLQRLVMLIFSNHTLRGMFAVHRASQPTDSP